MKRIFILMTLTLMLTSCEEEKTIYVADHTVNCSIDNSENCLLVKEKKADEWQKFSDTIEGFNYEEGYTYELKIKITKGKDSKLTYSLIEVISKTKKNSSINNTWVVKSISGFDNQTGKSPVFTITDGRISGNSGCNQFSGNFKTDTKNHLFKVDALISTKMYCDKTAKLETAFFDVFNQVEHYQINGDLLQIIDSKGTVLLTASLQEKTKKSTIQIRYSATSRAYGSTLILKDNIITFNQARPTVIKTEKKLDESDLDKIIKLVNAIDIDQIEKLIPPSKAFTYDGAAGAIVELTIDGKTYRTPTFDYGNPPEAIKTLIETLEKLK